LIKIEIKKMSTAKKTNTSIFLNGGIFSSSGSGVHLAVREEILSMLPFLPIEQTAVLYQDSAFWENISQKMQMAKWKMPKWTSTAIMRIFWQQSILPFILKKYHAERLFSPAYTTPLGTSVPTLLHVHDVIALDYPEFCAKKNVLHMQLLLARSIRQAEKCIASSHYVADRMCANLNLSYRKIEVVPLGVDFSFFAKVSPVKQSYSPKKYFLFVGNIEPKKNITRLLDAYAECAEKTKTKLIIVGRAGWKVQHLTEKIQHWKGPGEVQWLGRVEKSSLPGLYQQALALVMPSQCEGFGLPILEAMAAGCPVIHSDCAALLETAAGNGCPFELAKRGMLAKKMTEVASSANYRRELKEAGKIHAKKCSWKKWGKTAADLLLHDLGV